VLIFNCWESDSGVDPYPILFNPMKVPLGLQAHTSEKEVRGSVKGLLGSSGKVGEDAAHSATL